MRLALVLLLASTPALAQERYDIRDFLDAGYAIVGVAETGFLISRVYLQKGDSLFVCDASFDTLAEETILYGCYDALENSVVTQSTETPLN